MERIAKEHKADIRKFSCTSHVVAITYGHLTKARSLSEICAGSGIPSFAIVDKASAHDSTRAEDICVNLKDGDILLADRAYVKFDFLHGLSRRGIYFVLREKKNICFEVMESRTHDDPSIISDETIKLEATNTSKKYPDVIRRVKAVVEVDGKKVEMTFLTNNFQWSPRTIAELYRRRWAVEIFFKEIKQTLQLADFIGYNDKAVKWQVWIGLLTHILLRLLKHLSKWKLSFSRLYGVVKSAVWMRLDLFGTLRIYGTADPPRRPVAFSKHLYLKGFEPNTSNPMGQP